MTYQISELNKIIFFFQIDELDKEQNINNKIKYLIRDWQIIRCNNILIKIYYSTKFINIIIFGIIYLLVKDIPILRLNCLFFERQTSIFHFHHKNELRYSKI